MPAGLSGSSPSPSPVEHSLIPNEEKREADGDCSGSDDDVESVEDDVYVGHRHKQSRRSILSGRLGTFAAMVMAVAFFSVVLGFALAIFLTSHSHASCSSAFDGGGGPPPSPTGALDGQPTVILVSFDGFRHGYHLKADTPNLNRHGRAGMGGQAWEGRHGRARMGGHAWEGRHGRARMGGHAWEGTHGRARMGGHAWEGTHGRARMGGHAWEGTHGRAAMGGQPTVIVVSFDGFRHGYHLKADTPSALGGHAWNGSTGALGGHAWNGSTGALGGHAWNGSTGALGGHAWNGSTGALGGHAWNGSTGALGGHAWNGSTGALGGHAWNGSTGALGGHAWNGSTGALGGHAWNGSTGALGGHAWNGSTGALGGHAWNGSTGALGGHAWNGSTGALGGHAWNGSTGVLGGHPTVTEGTFAEHGMLPVFPSLTFPSHHSMATGLLPASHGIIANKFRLPSNHSDVFSPGNVDPRWWLGEPIWTTVNRQVRGWGGQGERSGVWGINTNKLHNPSNHSDVFSPGNVEPRWWLGEPIWTTVNRQVRGRGRALKRDETGEGKARGVGLPSFLSLFLPSPLPPFHIASFSPSSLPQCPFSPSPLSPVSPSLFPLFPPFPFAHPPFFPSPLSAFRFLLFWLLLLQGLQAATVFWPGSDVSRPDWPCPSDYCLQYNESMPFEQVGGGGRREEGGTKRGKMERWGGGKGALDQVLAWLDLPAPLRPSFLSLYLEEPDESGHLGGPDTPLVAAAVKRVDGMLGRLLTGLDQRSMTNDVNLLLVSDHGMLATCKSRVISLEQFEPFIPGLSPAWIDFSYPLLGIFLPQTDAQRRPGSAGQDFRMDAAAVVGAMRRAIEGGGIVNGEALKVYLREEFPAEFEFSGSDRIPAILALADEGYSVVYHHSSAWDGGMHGYDNRLPSMRSIFMARGPRFASHRRIPTFRNTELYNVITSILEIQPASNNGSSSFPDTILV
ncbi:unnamed protein product [Closterium sp. NIES-64]|nr:unnamed protein product [Closterium sp. NIES-64]